MVRKASRAKEDGETYVSYSHTSVTKTDNEDEPSGKRNLISVLAEFLPIITGLSNTIRLCVELTLL